MTRESAIGDGGRSHGMFQINEDYHLERTWIMGREYDPHDVYDAAVLTGMLYRKNLRATKSKAMAVATTTRRAAAGSAPHREYQNKTAPNTAIL